jgi:hypothetical protein
MVIGSWSGKPRGTWGTLVSRDSCSGLNPARITLDSPGKPTENGGMEIRGRIHNGVVVLEGELSLPEGTMATVSYPVAPSTQPPEVRRRVQLPLVRSDHPGSLRLTAERVAELLEDDDVCAGR